MQSIIMLGPSPPPPPPETSSSSSNSLKNLFHGILSYDSNIMLAAVISLLLVILFVLLLHVYAKWFLVHARRRSRRSVSVPQVLGTRFHHHRFHSFTIDAISTFSESPTNKGLESWAISEIPLFVYKLDDDHLLQHGLVECAICLSFFEDEEVGRRLPKCSHVFHVECIDMWLHSHSSCPICRAPVMLPENQIVDSSSISNEEPVHNEEPISSLLFEDENRERMSNYQDSVLEIIVEVPNNNSENGNVGMKDSVISVCNSLSPSLHGSPFHHGDSVKKIISKNRSERRIHPSSTSVNELDV